jgi:hypothetical protein
MAQKNTQSLQIAPETVSEPSTEANNDTGSIRAATSLRALAAMGAGQTVQHKAAFLGDIRQKLAQIADEAKKHGEEASETENLAATAATRLFLARKEGVISGDELSGLLGDTFGYQPKADGTPGKTPAGPGRTMRMRIVRALQGVDWLNGSDGGRFFDTMDPDAEVAVGDKKLTARSVIENIGKTEEKDVNGEKKMVLAEGASVWNAYKVLGDIKSAATVRLPFAFDAKKIIGLTDSLSEAGARDKIIGNPSLLKSYLGLLDQLLIIDQVDASEVEAIQAKLGLQNKTAEEVDEEVDDDGEKVAA